MIQSPILLCHWLTTYIQIGIYQHDSFDHCISCLYTCTVFTYSKITSTSPPPSSHTTASHNTSLALTIAFFQAPLLPLLPTPPPPRPPLPPSSTTATPPWPPCSPPHPPPPPPQHSPPPPIPRPSGQTSTPCLVFVGTRAMRRRKRRRRRRGWMKGKRPKES